MHGDTPPKSKSEHPDGIGGRIASAANLFIQLDQN
jgi:hypothetical protein